MPTIQSALWAAVVAATLGAQKPPASIRWAPSLAVARAAAQATGRPVILYFTFDT